MIFEEEYEINPVKIPVEKQLLSFSNYENLFPEISRVVWQYFGYSGLFTPWHDSVPLFYFPGHRKYLSKTINYLVESDISLNSFGYLTLPLHKPEDWDSPSVLFSANWAVSWTKKLARFVGDRENLDYLAYFMLNYFQNQVVHFGKAQVEFGQVVKKEGKNYRLEGYERLWSRILELSQLGADPIMWMQAKMEKFVNFYPGEVMNFNCMVNRNGLEPDIETLQKRSVDPWREIKDFLGLSIDCQIIDGYLPKGWQPSGEDFEERTKIVRISGDGHYYNEKGTQRKGKWHYCHNSYLGIRCDIDNFGIFKDSWADISLLMKMPTWEEYKNWAIHPNLWGEDGLATNGRGKSVKWRKIKDGN